ncbi:MAG: hypothetical protein OSA11_02305 [Candidatus Nanopelagicales bacterium]|nr:hypothetical protein [Candidatus Nanopelagicales bacterium]
MNPRERPHGLTMECSALLELLKSLKVDGVSDRVRLATQVTYRALIDVQGQGMRSALSFGYVMALMRGSVTAQWRGR